MKCKRGIRKRPNYSEYWKNRIGYDYREEIKIYKYLCGSRMIKKPEEKYRFTEKAEWKKYTCEKYKDCEKEKLVSFLDYLRQQKRNCEMEKRAYVNVLIPFIIGMVLSDRILGIFDTIKIIIKDPLTSESVKFLAGLLLSYIGILGIAILLIQGIKVIFDTEDRKYFYEDYMTVIVEIVDNVL